MAARLNVTLVPSTFLVDPDANTVSAVAYGFTDWTSLGAKMLHANDQMQGGGAAPQLALRGTP